MTIPLVNTASGSTSTAVSPNGGNAPAGLAGGATLTPMLAQYFDVKKDHPDALLFYRMGDFYELFFQDAVLAAGALDIALTKRGRQNGQDIPMCGVPYHAADAYLSRLIRKGFRVAICDQIEDPAEARKRGRKAVVMRAVSRIVTPGTVIEDTLLEARSHNFLAGLSDAQGRLGLAWADMSTGDLHTQALSRDGLGTALSRISPSELLVPDRYLDSASPLAMSAILEDWQSAVTTLPASRFDSVNGTRRLETTFGVASMAGFGTFERAELAAAGALVDYIGLTQNGRKARLSPPRRWQPGNNVDIDSATRSNLELVRTLSGERRGSLLWVIDRTVTGPGARLLSSRISAPLTDPSLIAGRLDEVTYFVDADSLRDCVRENLRRTSDLERALSRLALGRGGPRDLAAIRDGLRASGDLREYLSNSRTSLVTAPTGICQIGNDLGCHETFIERVGQALVDNPPLQVRDGGFVARGYSADLDRLRKLRDESRRLIAELQKRYVEETGIASLKIRHNNLLGYFVEVKAVHGESMNGREAFIHRQSMANAMRYTTLELGQLEQELGKAAEQALALEAEIFARLSADVLANGEAVSRTAGALARLDVASALAELAVDRRYVRPVLDDSLDLEITGGRHPVVEALAKDGEPFIANGCDLAPDQRLWLLTGPNMAGKSTFLRQNALIVLLAQTGSYVPATAARIGVVDRLFSRVGAADDLARGRSTFMVEMVETAAILNQATERSLVILDEIGRGTATFDGLSIAWATIEHLHEVNRCRTLFATHYHELTVLASKLPALACHTMRVREWNDEIVFLHEVGGGAADRSYGIHVAKLAGMPKSVTRRAEAVLEQLETDDKARATSQLAEDLPLFQVDWSNSGTEDVKAESAVEVRLAEINPDELTPMQALQLIYDMRDLLEE